MLHFSRWKVALILLVCMAATLLALPNFVQPERRAQFPEWMQHTVSLGLDLQGGSYLLLEVDTSAYVKDQYPQLADQVRRALREKNIGYIGLKASTEGVVFTLRDPSNTEAESAIAAISPELVVAREGQGYRVSYNEAWHTQTKRRLLEQSLEIVARRVDETGTREPIIQRQGEDRILLQVPGLQNPEHLKELLGRTAKMTFHLVDTSVSQQSIVDHTVPPGTLLVPDDKPAQPGQQPVLYPVFEKVELSGDLLVDAHPAYDNQSGEPVVAFRFNAAGAQTFGEITSANIGKPFAIVLDGKVITAPVIRSAILGGNGIISGSFTTQSATDLSILLRAGALPAPLKVVEERTVGPSLGADSISAGMKAALAGVALVVVFMLAWYGLFGLFADLAMVVNALIVLALMSLIGATLTLPGIAGIVLTMGMAVDTNVLIYERMREEMRGGKNVYASIESGFRMAFGTIIDAHVTTLSAALLLYYFGSGSVKGFGLTLAIGIVASLFTAILVTRLMIVSWLQWRKPSRLPI